MNFTEYRRMRRNEEDEDGKYSNTSFTQIRKQRNPEKYAQQELEKYSQQIAKRNEYIDNVNSYLQSTNMNIAGQVGKLQSNQYVADDEMSDYVARTEYDNAQMRKKAFELMVQAGKSDTVDYTTSKQIREALKNTVSRYNAADEANDGYAKYMSQFENQTGLDRQLAAAKEAEAANAMSEEELKKSIEELTEQSKQLKSQYGDAVKSPKRDREQILNIDSERKDIDSKIEEYKNLIYKKRQSSAIESLSDESKAAFDKYYSYQNDTPGVAETLATMTGFYDGYARQRKKNALEDEAKQALAGQGISEDEFDSLYEYYSFAKDEQRNAENVEKWKADYNEAGTVGKIAQNVGTALNTPIRGLAASVEDIAAKNYVNEYAPLNVNSVAYDMTNWTDTIRESASENTDYALTNFLYQTGMSMADFGMLAALAGVTGGSSGGAAADAAKNVVLGIMGTNAATSAAKEATLRGVNKEDALLTGLAAGAAEIAFEKIPLEKFFGVLKNSGKEVAEKTFKEAVLKPTGKQAVMEGLEEVFTDISNMFTDNLINGGMSEYYQNVQRYYQNGATMEEAKNMATVDFAKQLGLSFLGGAVSGGSMTFGATFVPYAFNKIAEKRKTKAQTQTQDNAVENIQNAALPQESAQESPALEMNQSAETEQNVQLESESESKSETVNTTVTEEQIGQTNTRSKSEALEQQSSPEQVIGRLEETAKNDENFTRTNNVSQREQVESIAARLENETIAKAMVSDYKDGIPVETYTTAFKNFLNAGYTDMSFNDVLKSNSYITSVIDEATLKSIYYLGQNQAKLASQKYMSKAQKKLVKIAARAVGVNVEFADMPGINGMYKNGTIYISEYATQPAMVVFAHELTHHLKANVSEAYSTYENFVIDYMKEYHAEDYQKIRESLIKNYGTDENLIREEIAANASELFLTDEEAVKRFAKNNKTVAQRIAEFFNEFVEKLKSLYADYEAKGKAGKIISEDMDIYERARDLWYAALEENVTDSVTNEGGDTLKFSFKGVDENGVEEYETPDSIKNLSRNEKKKKIVVMMKELYRGRTAKFQLNNKTYYALLVGDSVKKGIYGDKKSTQEGYIAKLNVAAEGNYFELLENALYVNSRQNRNGKSANNSIHNKNTSWDYFEKQVKIDNDLYDVIINVANNKDNQFVYDVTLKRAYQPTAKENIQPVLNRGRLSIDNVSQSDTKSKRKFSKKTLEDVGIRFSLKNDSMIDEELEQVADISVEAEELVEHTGKILEEAVKTSGDLKRKKISKDMCKNMAEQYLKKYNAVYDKKLLADNLYNIFAYIQKSPDDVNYEDMVRVMEEVCKPVIETSKLMDKATVEQYQRFSEYVKSKPIKLTQAQQSKIAQLYGSYEKFREAYKGKYGFDDANGVSLNSLWSDFVEKSDSALYSGTKYEDRMVELHRYMTFMDRSSRETADGMSTQQHSYDMALDIYTNYFRLINTDKGAYRNLEKQIRQELSEYKKKASDYYQQIYSRQLRKESLKKDNQIKALESQIRDLEFEMASDTDTMIDLNDEILKLKKNIKDVKARNVEKIARMEAQNYDSYINRQRASKKTVVKNRIRRNMTDLQNRLARPKENKYIPRELVRATVDLCEAVNIDTGKSVKLAERMASLANLYERLKNDSDYVVASEYDEHTANAIKRLQSIFNGHNIMELELEELEQVDSVVSQLYFQITNAGKLIREGKAKDVYETAIHCMEEIEAADGYKDNIIGRGLNKYVSFSLNPETMFHRMSGYKDDSVLNEMYDELNAGEKKKMQVLMDLSKMFEPVVSGNHNQKAARNLVGLDKSDWIDLGLRYKNTEPVMVPKAFRVSLAMHIQNKSNLDHIIYGGLTIPEPKAYQRGDYDEAYTRGTTIKFIPAEADTVEKRQAAYKEAERKLKGIVSEMTPYEREFMRYAEKFFHEYSGEKINEVSLKLNGYKKAVVNKYFPIRTDYNFTHSEFEGLVKNGALETMPMLNSRVGARNPIILEDITRVTQRQSDNVAKYYGLAIPVRNFNKVYNATAKGYEQSTKKVIAQKWGKSGQKYVENLLTDLQTVRGSENTIADKLRGNFAASTLTMNLNVALSQLSAHPTGAYTTGWEACIYSLSKFNKKVDFDLINKYTPLLWYRNQGNMTQEMADIKKYSWLNMLSERSAEKLPGELGKIGKVPMAAVNMLQILDTKVIGNLWYACEYSVSKQQPSLQKGTDAYYEEVAKQFDKMIEVTQSNYTTMQRSEMLRSPNKATKQMFMFMTQPLQNFSILYDATMNMQTKSKQFKAGTVSREAAQKAKEQFARAWSSQIAAAFAYAGLRVIGNALLHSMNKYRDDEEEITAAQLLEGFAGDALGSLAGSAIAGNEIYSFFSSLITGERYYGLSVSTIEMLDDLLTDIVNLGNAQEITAEMVKNLVFDISNVTGQPIKNVWKIINGMGLHIEDAKNGEILSFNAGYEVTLSKQYNAMLNALADGDTDRYAEHEQKAMDKLLLTKDEADAKKSVKSGIKSKLKEMYQSGDISYEQAKSILEKNLEDDKAYFTLQSWDSSGDYNQYDALQKAVISGNGIEVAMKELTDNGIKSDTVETKLWAIIKEAYAGGQLSEGQTVEYLKRYKDSEYSEDDTYWILRKWKSGDSEYTQNADLQESVEKGNFDEVVAEYLEHGYDVSKVKSALSSKYREEYIELYRAGNHSGLLELKNRLGELKVKGRRLYTQDDWLSWNKAAKE